MQIETDGESLILTPQTQMEYYQLGRIRLQKINYTLVFTTNEDVIRSLRINKKDLLTLLLD